MVLEPCPHILDHVLFNRRCYQTGEAHLFSARSRLGAWRGLLESHDGLEYTAACAPRPTVGLGCPPETKPANHPGYHTGPGCSTAGLAAIYTLPILCNHAARATQPVRRAPCGGRSLSLCFGLVTRWLATNLCKHPIVHDGQSAILSFFAVHLTQQLQLGSAIATAVPQTLLIHTTLSMSLI